MDPGKDKHHQLTEHLTGAHSAVPILSLLDSIPDLIFFKDMDGRYLGCNNEFAKHVGHGKDYIVGKTDYELYSKKEADFFRETDRHMLALNNVFKMEWITYPDGQKAFHETIKTPFRDHEGNIVGIIGISRDITARKQAEEALQKSEEKYCQLFEGAPISLWEEDCSEIKQRIDQLKTHNKENLRSFFFSQPELVRELAGLVRVLNVNQATLNLYKAAHKEELFSGITKVLPITLIGTKSH